MSNHTRRNPRRLLSTLALASGSLFVSLLLAEGAYRLLRPQATVLDHQPTIYQPDPIVGWRFTPNSSDYMERYEFRVPIEINGAGFRDDEFALTPPQGGVRIAVVGDSFTAGFQVERGCTFPDVLEQELNGSCAADCPYEVLNFGITGIGTVEEAGLIEETVLDFDPDIVVVAFAHNDVGDARKGGLAYKETYRGYILTFRDESSRDALAQRVDNLFDQNKTLYFGVTHSYLVRAIYSVWLDASDPPRPNFRSNKVGGVGSLKFNQNQAYEVVDESIERIQNACLEAGCELVFVMIPARFEMLEGKDPTDGPVVQALEERGIPTLELRETFEAHLAQGEDLYWEHDGHTNEVGYRLMAEETAIFLQREGLLVD